MNRRKVTLTLALVLALVMGAYVAWPRHADPRGFEPAEIARLETAMWRERWPASPPSPTVSWRMTRRC
jgi:hypothetical protein